MKKAFPILFLALAACSPEKKIEGIEVVISGYSTTVETAVALYDLGKISKDDLARFNEFRKPVRAAIDAWANALLEGREETAFREASIASLLQLQAFLNQVKQ